MNKNGIGQRTGMLDGSGGTAWSFDNRGRLTSETRTVTGGGLFRTQYGYNTANMQIWMKYPADNAANTGEQVSSGYNSQGTFSTLQSSINGYYYVPLIVYDAAGRIVERQYGATVPQNPLLKSVYTYNALAMYSSPSTQGGRLSQATAGLFATPDSLQKLQYTYDAAGNILSIQDFKAGSPQTQTFTYDSLNRLVTAAASGGTGNYGNYSQETTAYDPTTGNISSTTAMGTYTYTDSAHVHAVTKLNGVQKYWYDANGNMTTRVTDATYLLSYNAENQLTAISGGSVNTGYVYDGDGVRVKSTNLYQNLAAGASVTSTVTLTYPDVITNGDNYADSGAGSSREYAYTAAGGLQYVQVDLGAVYNLDKVSVWHYFNDGRTYHNTKTQVSADGRNWTTIFDSAVSGEYAETAGGKTTSFTTRSVRYIRDYANGSTANSGNHWVEMEAWGKADVTYIGSYFEWAGSVKTMASYYYAGGQRVALRRGSVLNYLLGDHLGSNSLSVDNVTGSRLTELRYKAWGTDRTAQNPGRMPTSYAYTGQRKDVAGLYFYNARWYDPALGRFIQADSIVPEASQGVQAWDRYAGMNNNALRYTDPSGHDVCDEEKHCFGLTGEYRIDEHQKKKPLFWKDPVANPAIGGGYDFGENNGTINGHNGVDLNPPPYDLVASSYGIVVSSDACTANPCRGISQDTNAGYGNMIIIEYKYEDFPVSIRIKLEYGKSLFILYGHMVNVSPLSSGSRVFPGQNFGKIGSTGNSSGPHVHIEVRTDEHSTNYSFSDGFYSHRLDYWVFSLLDPHDIWRILVINPESHNYK